MPTDLPSAPLLDAEMGFGMSAPGCAIGDLTPSAPPVPLAPDELQQLLQQLPSAPPDGQPQDLPTAQALRSFRAATAGRLVWADQMRQAASATSGGQQFLREAYERQFLLDPEALTATDGPWVHQALESHLTVVRYDGRVVNLSADTAIATGLDIGEQAAKRMGDVPFDPSKHKLFGVGKPSRSVLSKGSIVKVTGLTSSESLMALNGMVGQVSHFDGETADVALQSGLHRVHQDNLVAHDATVVTRCATFEMDLSKTLPLESGSRVLWLEAQPSLKCNAEQRTMRDGPLRAIKQQHDGMSASKSGVVSAGELRNFLWNLHLGDADFARVQKRFAPDSDYVDLREVIFLLGRPHLQCQNVPVDALIYEAVVSILGRCTTAHIDCDLAEDVGLGYGKACAKHCVSYTFSLFLQGVVFFNLAVLTLWCIGVELFDMSGNMVGGLAWCTGIAYLVYLLHLACCVRLTRAFANQTEGVEAVMHLMEKPRHENPQYTWHVQCYHFEVRTHTRKDKEGRTHTYQERVRVDTHSARISGSIPSEDRSETFVPSTFAAQTQINTHLDLDFSESNYISEYQTWCNFHRWDIHQDCTRNEYLPSQATSCLALWSTRRPCWMTSGVYWLCNVCLLSFFYRLYIQSRIGHRPSGLLLCEEMLQHSNALQERSGHGGCGRSWSCSGSSCWHGHGKTLVMRSEASTSHESPRELLCSIAYEHVISGFAGVE